MKFIGKVFRGALVVSIFSSLVPTAASAAVALQDVVTVGTVSGAVSVDVPVYIRDTAGTALGIDQPAGSRIQSYSLTVHYAPAASVQSATFTRGGITQTLTPSFESSPSSAGTVSLIDTFNEATNLIPFTSNAALPGNRVGTLHLNLDPSLAPGTVITLTLDPALTELSNQAGTTVETTTGANLALVNGSITVSALTDAPTLSQWALILLAAALALAAVRIRM
jgi:hypothetical protein